MSNARNAICFGIFKPQLPDISRALSEKGGEGWQLKQAILPSMQGSSDRVVLILERMIE
jgi:hypothetical protein